MSFKISKCLVAKVQKHIKSDALWKRLFDPLHISLGPHGCIYDNKNLNLSYLVRKERRLIEHFSNVTHNTWKRCIYKQFKVSFGLKYMYILCFVDISKYFVTQVVDNQDYLNTVQHLLFPISPRCRWILRTLKYTRGQKLSTAKIFSFSQDQ